MEKKFIDGNTAIAYGVMLSGAEVIAAYPITPQTKIVEKLSELLADGELDAEYIKVESEHSAGSACFGAASTGVRTFTATSSQGLAYMHEMLHYISGARLPVVMAVVNRSLSPPWGIWGDHQDSISTRDTGWIQLYMETAQEALDSIIQAYRIAEDKQVLVPVMVCLDAFVLSHTDELVYLPGRGQVQEYLPPLSYGTYLDVNDPRTFSGGAIPEHYFKYKYEQQLAMERSCQVINQADEDFNRIFGRSYGGLVDPYFALGAKALLLVMGSMAGVVRDVVDSLQEEGLDVGMIRVRSFRPFPKQELMKLLKGVPHVGVIDRNCSFGYEGALFTEVKAALFPGDGSTKVHSFIGGFGGQEVGPPMIERIFRDLLGEKVGERIHFIGLGCYC